MPRGKGIGRDRGRLCPGLGTLAFVSAGLTGSRNNFLPAVADNDSRRELEAGWELTQLGPVPISPSPRGGKTGGEGGGHVVSQLPRAAVAPGGHTGAGSPSPLPTQAAGGRAAAQPADGNSPKNPWGEVTWWDTACPQLCVTRQQPKAGGTQRQGSGANSPLWGKLRQGCWQQEGLGRVKLPLSSEEWDF